MNEPPLIDYGSDTIEIDKILGKSFDRNGSNFERFDSENSELSKLGNLSNLPNYATSPQNDSTNEFGE